MIETIVRSIHSSALDFRVAEHTGMTMEMTMEMTMNIAASKLSSYQLRCKSTMHKTKLWNSRIRSKV